MGLQTASHRRHNLTCQIRKHMKTEEFVAAGPVSRILYVIFRQRDGHSSRPAIAGGLKRPTRRFDAPSQHVPRKASSLFGLAPCGVYHAAPITGRAVRSYRTFSPLPLSRRYFFCGTGRRLGLNPNSRTLSGTPLCRVRTFLVLPRDRPIRLPTSRL